ncbi:MAG: RNA methyltransferase [Patescibacteria group bacterium]
MATEKRINRIQEVVEKRQSGMTVVLEDIHDPHNIEAIFRSCDAFGIQRVCVIFEREQYFNPKRIGKSTSSSANKWLDFSVYRSTGECLDALAASRHSIVATSLRPTAASIYTADFSAERIALFVGNEHRGLSQSVYERADTVVRIPMLGMVESLNVSVTAAVFLYEISRQRAAAGKTFLLSGPDRDGLARDLLQRQ